MRLETAGDPITGLKWTRKTTEKISRELRKAGLDVSRNTVARLLKKMDYALRVNHKKLCRGSKSDRSRRNQQFEHLASLRRRFERKGIPIICVDSKKRELVGAFKNSGTVWGTSPRLVNDHDFRSDAKGIAIPYGIYDPTANRGHVFIGVSHDTSAFAVTALCRWWTEEGCRRYPDADRLFILADGGGSNGSRSRAWKYELQTRFCNLFGLAVTVGHYPPGASKWNPIEHRLFSEISKNWAGEPLDSYEKLLKFIRTTKTKAGLRVRATLLRGDYPTGKKISPDQMRELNLAGQNVLAQWNYTLEPASLKM